MCQAERVLIATFSRRKGKGAGSITVRVSVRRKDIRIPAHRLPGGEEGIGQEELQSVMFLCTSIPAQISC